MAYATFLEKAGAYVDRWSRHWQHVDTQKRVEMMGTSMAVSYFVLLILCPSTFFSFGIVGLAVAPFFGMSVLYYRTVTHEPPPPPVLPGPEALPSPEMPSLAARLVSWIPLPGRSPIRASVQPPLEPTAPSANTESGKTLLAKR